MRNDFDSRDWAENHEQMSEGIDRLIASIAVGFERLVAIAWAAPWKTNRDEARCETR
jgi:hypothetical protein